MTAQTPSNEQGQTAKFLYNGKETELPIIPSVDGRSSVDMSTFMKQPGRW